MTAITPEIVADHGLKPDEYERIKVHLEVARVIAQVETEVEAVQVEVGQVLHRDPLLAEGMRRGENEQEGKQERTQDGRHHVGERK